MALRKLLPSSSAEMKMVENFEKARAKPVRPEGQENIVRINERLDHDILFIERESEQVMDIINQYKLGAEEGLSTD
jgi:hypothetical protein